MTVPPSKYSNAKHRSRPRDTLHRRRYRVDATLSGIEHDIVEHESKLMGLSRGAYLRRCMLIVAAQERARRGLANLNDV